jgi:hypothetical protein
MMRQKGLIGLLVVTLVAVVLAVVLMRGGGSARNDPLAGTPVLPEVGPRIADIGRVTLVHGENKTTLVRQGEGWTVEERGGYQADATKVRAAILGLADLTYVEPKTKKADLYARLDLDDAGKKDGKSTLVTVIDEKGSLLGELIAGKRRVDQLGGGTDGIYVRKPGDAQTWLARGTLELAGDTPPWLVKTLLDIPAAKVKEAVLTAADGAKITLHRDKPGDKLALVELPAGKNLKSDTALDEPAGALAGLELNDVRPAADFGFPKDGLATARFTDFDGLTVTLSLTQKDGIDWAVIAASGEGAAAAHATELNAKLTPWVFALATYKAKALTTKLADLLEPAKGS